MSPSSAQPNRVIGQESSERPASFSIARNFGTVVNTSLPPPIRPASGIQPSP